MANEDGIVRIGTEVDVSGLRSGMEEAASTVENSSQTMAAAMEAARVAAQNLADAQQLCGVQAEQGVASAQAIIDSYQAAADAANQAAAAFSTTADATGVANDAFSQLAAATAEAAVSQANLRTAVRSVVDGTTPYALAIQSLTSALRENYDATQMLRSAKLAVAEASQAATAGTEEETAAATALIPASMEAAQGLEAMSAASGHQVSQMAAASGAVRLFEGGTRGSIRAVERFLSTTLGLGPILQAAFPIIGAIALAEMIVNVTERIIKLREEAEQAADNIRRSFDEATDSVRQSTASLLTQGDRLQEQLDKLLGHPGQNGLQVAFDEASSSALRLSDSIQKDIDKMEQLMSVENQKNSIGFWGSMFSGKAETDPTQKMLKQAEDSIQAINAEYQDVIDQARATGNKDTLFETQQHQLAALQVAYKTAETSVNASLQSMLDKQEIFSRYHIGEDYTASINMARGALKEWAAEQQNIGEQFRNENLQQQVTPLQEQHAGDSAAQKYARQVQEMSQESARAIDEAAKSEGAALERVNKAMAEAGKSPFLQSLAHDIPAAAGEARQQLVALAETISKLKTPTLDEDSGKQIEASFDKAEEAQIKLSDAQVEAYGIAQENADAMAEATLRAREATHTISPLAAAEQQAALHTREYTEALAALNAQLKVYQQVGKDAEAAATQNQIAALQGSRGVQATGDQAAIQQQIAQPWLNAFQTINQGWLQVQNQMFYSTRNIGLQFAKMGQQIFISIVDNLEKAALIAAERELIMLITHQAANNAKVASDAQAAAQSNSISAMTSIKQVTHAAAVAASKAYSAMAGIPVVGPILGAVAAATVFAAVEAFGAMASFDTGTGYVPSDGVAMLHQGEAVIPAPTMEDLRGSDGGGGDVNITQHNNWNTMTDREFKRQLDRHASHVAGAVQKHLRQRGKR